MKRLASIPIILLAILTVCVADARIIPTAFVSVGSRQFRVEIARNADEQRTGLSNRSELPEGSGMLFTFADRKEQQVWMAGMRVRIDAAWIVNDRVLAIKTLIPCWMSDQSACPRWTSPGVVDELLEVPAGELKDVRVGEKVTVNGI